MNNIEITWLADQHSCDVCGGSYAMGAKIKMNGEEILHLKPFAHCFDEQDWTEGQVYDKILEVLGFDVHVIQGEDDGCDEPE